MSKVTERIKWLAESTIPGGEIMHCGTRIRLVEATDGSPYVGLLIETLLPYK